MKRIMTAAFIAVIGISSVLAQEVQVRKPRLIIENFSCADGVSDAVRDQVRTNVISAFIETDRFEVMDVNSQASIDGEGTRRESENAMYDELARTGNIVLKANNYILRGSLLSCSTQSSVVDGKTRYSYELSYSITLVDVAESKDVATKTFSHGSLGTQSVVGGTGGNLLNMMSTYASAVDAINGGLSLVDDDVKKFLVETLPLEGEVIAEDYEVKRDKLTACYINIGSDLGTKVGDRFKIMVAQVRAGRTILREIGTLKVKEVLDGTLSYCTVTREGRAVLEAMEEFHSMADGDPGKRPLVVKQTL